MKRPAVMLAFFSVLFGKNNPNHFPDFPFYNNRNSKHLKIFFGKFLSHYVLLHFKNQSYKTYPVLSKFISGIICKIGNIQLDKRIISNALIVGVIIVIVRNYVAVIITSTFVPILKHVAPHDTLTDILLIAVSIASVTKACYILFYQKRYPSATSIILYIIFLSIFIYFKNLGYWQFYDFRFFSMDYIDILPILVVPLLRFTFITREKQNIESILFEDTKDSFETDLLKREKLVLKIVEYIKNSSPNKAFAIGLIGKWGSGKTILMEDVYNQLKKHDDIIIFHFNPWLHRGADLIIEDFFTVLQNNLAKYDSNLSNQIEEYSRKLLSEQQGIIGKTLDSILHFISPEKTNEERYIQIGKRIKNLNRKIIILVDDIDRLTGEEILAVLRLIRNTASFPKTFFIVAYDYDYILNTLNKEQQFEVDGYLEKIFQLEIPLPEFNRKILPPILTKILTKRKNENDKEKIRSVINNLASSPKKKDILSNTFFEDYIHTLRDIIRYANLINVYYDLMKDEIDLFEFFHLNLIKLKFPSVHNLIANRYYLTGGPQTINGSFRYSFAKDDFKAYAFLNTEKLHISIQEIEVVAKSLDYIFNSNEPVVSTRSIRYPTNLLLYFSPELFDKVSLREFNEIRNADDHTLYSTILRWLNGEEKQDLLKILEEITTYNSQRDFQQIIKSLFFIGGYIQGISSDFFQDILLNKIKNIDNIVKLFYSDNNSDYKLFLKKLFEENEYSIVFRSKIIGTILYQTITKTSLFNLLFEKEELQDIQIFLLRQLTQQRINIEILFDIYYKCYDLIDPLSNEIMLSDIASNIMRNYLITHSNEFPAVAIMDYAFPSDQIYVLKPFMENIFGSYEEFEKFLKFLPPTVESWVLKQFYSAYKANEYKPTFYHLDKITLVSDENVEFIYSKTYPNLRPSRNSVLIKHAKENVKQEFKELRNSFWIAHALDITEEEATKGGEYSFGKNFQMIFDEGQIKRATFNYIVDDFCTASINGRLICQDEKTNWQMQTKDITDFIENGNNSLDIQIRNIDSTGYPFDKKIPLSKQNPYGIIFAIEIFLEQAKDTVLENEPR